MVNSITIKKLEFEDSEVDLLERAKGNMEWKDAILKWAQSYIESLKETNK